MVKDEKNIAIKQDILEIIKAIIPEINILADLTLKEIGINSIQYIRIIVMIEEKMNLEFADEYLVFDDSIRAIDLVQVVMGHRSDG